MTYSQLYFSVPFAVATDPGQVQITCVMSQVTNSDYNIIYTVAVLGVQRKKGEGEVSIEECGNLLTFLLTDCTNSQAICPVSFFHKHMASAALKYSEFFSKHSTYLVSPGFFLFVKFCCNFSAFILITPIGSCGSKNSLVFFSMTVYENFL